MTKRLVVCMRWRPEGAAEPGNTFAQACDVVIERMAALGGRLIVWHPEWLALDFSLESLQDALDFLVDRPVPGFSVGFAHGPLHELLDGGPMLAACIGPTVERAVALARMARPTEVLVEPGLVKASGGELLMQGARVATIAGERVRGLKLDLIHPQRSLECDSVTRLRIPALRGPKPQLETAPGALGLVRAARGGGASRFLEELRALEPGPALAVTGWGAGEPLGALTQAILDQLAKASDEPALSPAARQTLQALSRGQGANRERTSELLGEYVKAANLTRSVYVFDADHVDGDSLEALAEGCRTRGLALVASVESRSHLPAALTGLPLSGELALPGLSLDDGSQLLRDAASGELEQEWASWLAQRGTPHPLAVSESLIEALDSASFLWAASGVVPRLVRQEPPEPQTAAILMRRRLHFVDSSDRLVLDALAVLGGSADQRRVAAVLRLAGREVANVESSVNYLARFAWLELGPGTRVSLRSRTAAEVICASLSATRFVALHQAASTLSAESGRPLELVSAALHASLAGNHGKASLLAKRSSEHLRGIQLLESAAQLETYAATGELDGARERLLPRRAELWSGRSVSDESSPDQGPRTEPPVAPPHNQTLPAEAPAPSHGEGRRAAAEVTVALPKSANLPAVLEEANEPAPGRQAGLEVPAVARAWPAAAAGLPNAGFSMPPEAESDRISETDLEAMSADDVPAAPASDTPRGGAPAPAVHAPGAPDSSENGQRTSPTLRVHHIPSDSESLMPERASQALRRGDPVTLDELARQLRSEAHSVLADRLDAMACLVRGDVGEALRRLRAAKSEAQRMNLNERCRASLALSVAIAAAGRTNDALLEVLEGLAFARRVGDLRGERACAKFLAQLAERSGQQKVAERWLELSSHEARG